MVEICGFQSLRGRVTSFGVKTDEPEQPETIRMEDGRGCAFEVTAVSMTAERELRFFFAIKAMHFVDGQQELLPS